MNSFDLSFAQEVSDLECASVSGGSAKKGFAKFSATAGSSALSTPGGYAVTYTNTDGFAIIDPDYVVSNSSSSSSGSAAA